MIPRVFKPVRGDIRISSPYGPRKDPLSGEPGTTHYGIDFATPVHTPVVAMVTGKIIKAGWENPKDVKQGFGFRVWQMEEETDNYFVYGHLSEQSVKEGDRVVAGTRIGLSGNTGKSSGPHLHIECRQGGIAGFKGVPFNFIGDNNV